MIVVSHHIAGITFRTESNTWLPRLQEEPYERFRVGDDRTPDVRHRIRRVDADSLTLPSLPEKEREHLLRGVHVAPGAWDSPLLHSPAVLARLRANLDQPEQMGVWLYQDRALVNNFSCSVLDLFYTEAYGEYKGPFYHLRAGVGLSPDAQARLHKIAPDSLSLAPLTEEERARLPGDTYHAPRVLDSPLLRSPLVRTRLQEALDRPEQEVRLYWDGMMVLDESRQVIDFFYMDDVGERDAELGLRTPEGRVAFNFRQIFSTFLPQFSAFLVHSAGVIRDGRAALFLAPDEGGKTTVLNHSPEGLMLNDDQIVLRKEGEAIIAHGTPLGRVTSGPCQARLGALFVLDKASRFELRPVKPAELMGLVQACWDAHKNYTFFLPKRLKVRAFEVLHDAYTQSPVYWMRFPKDYVDWDAIDEALRE